MLFYLLVTSPIMSHFYSNSNYNCKKKKKLKLYNESSVLLTPKKEFFLLWLLSRLLTLVIS